MSELGDDFRAMSEHRKAVRRTRYERLCAEVERRVAAGECLADWYNGDSVVRLRLPACEARCRACRELWVDFFPASGAVTQGHRRLGTGVLLALTFLRGHRHP